MRKCGNGQFHNVLLKLIYPHLFCKCKLCAGLGVVVVEVVVANWLAAIAVAVGPPNRV